jgi:cytosine/adenosine deaminase-related metal-dependent hydrolase
VLVIDGCYVATVNAAGSEYPGGYLVLDGDRIAAVGAGPVPPHYAAAERIDGSGLLATPGLVNTHHHLYQWITRGYATDDPVRLADHAVSGLGRPGRGAGPGLGRGQPGLAGADRLQHDHRPSLRVPGRAG